MAYFSNATEGSVFDHQCSLCKYGDELCPICIVQMNYNYEACNNKVARKILDYLVNDDGTCAMYKEFKKDFSKKEEEKDAPSLYDEVFPEEKTFTCCCGLKFGNLEAMRSHFKLHYK